MRRVDDNDTGEPAGAREREQVAPDIRNLQIMVPLSRRLVRRQNSVLMLLVQELTKNPQAASVTPVSKTVGRRFESCRASQAQGP